MIEIDGDDIQKFSIGYELLEERLNSYHIDAEKVEVDEPGFSRAFKFKALGHLYNIIWYCNVSTLITRDDMEVQFDNMIIGYSSRQRYKRSMHFYHKGDSICQIPIEMEENHETND